MSNHIIPESPNVLLQIAQKYKNEQQKQQGLANELLHFHDKNPDAAQQIKFLEESYSYITTNINPRERNKAVLSILLIFKALLTDPNQKGQIFDYLAEKLDMDNEINKILQVLNPGVEVDLLDPRYLEISKSAFEFCQLMIESSALKEKFPVPFLKELRGTIITELDYIRKVENSMNFSTLKP
jgi:hypothetical protein